MYFGFSDVMCVSWNDWKRKKIILDLYLTDNKHRINKKCLSFEILNEINGIPTIII